MSPYLFILGSEVLLRLLNREISQKRLSRVKVSNAASPISKLCYADDIILFCKAKFAKISILKSYPEKFCSWSGQLISVKKSSYFPSKGVSSQFISQIKHTWGLNTLPQNATYLGVPLFLSKSRNNDFKFIKEKAGQQVMWLEK